MTLDELNEHLGLLEDLATTREIRESFLTKAKPGAAPLTGMPHGSGVKDKVGDLAAEIADLDEQIETLEWAVQESEKHVLPFIDSIRDIQTRMIFRLRFVRGLSWKKVAWTFGKTDSEDAVKKICYRYLGVRADQDAKAKEEQASYFKTLFGQ